MAEQSGKAKTVLVISSQVIRGAVGNRVNVFVLERLGFSVWAMPTVLMPWQPRQGASHKLAVADADFAAWAEEIAASPKADEIDAVISGYFVSARQAETAAELAAALKARRKAKGAECLLLCDPIMGNEHGPYVPREVMQAVSRVLVPAADIVKPNRNELEWICGAEFRDNAAIISAVRQRFGKPFFVSSAFAAKSGDFANLYYDGKEIWLAEHSAFATPLNGFGDIIAALLLFYRLRGAGAEETVGKISASVYEYLAWTLKIGADELALPSAPCDLAKPREKVTLRRLG